MFEYHGWATVSDSLDDETDAADGLSRETYARVAELISTINVEGWQVADIRVANGSCHVWLAGLRNHRQSEVLNTFRAIAAVAPWSYGILNVFDDEDASEGSDWVTWVMKRGSVERHPDRFLSPHVGVVKDHFD
ncbi:MAG: Imm7 family immunity protein [Beijerinckiaceae bacterium]|nr:Imm7 family immunity protein [Beijerinckiaceae bacterium]